MGGNERKSRKEKVAANLEITATCRYLPLVSKTLKHGVNSRGGNRTSTTSSLKNKDLRQYEDTGGSKNGSDSEFPPDLLKIIAHWDSLPAEIKQTILALVKHSRKRNKTVTKNDLE